MLSALASLALACAPHIHPVTLNALIRHESGARQYAIGVNSKRQASIQQPGTLEEAQRTAQDLMAQGVDFDAGLGQINVRNWHWLGLDSTTVFDPCKNLTAAQTVLSACYARALRHHRQPQQALRAALSCYNTGNLTRGFANGYVGKVLAQAGIVVPALKPEPDDEAPTDDAQPATTDSPDTASAPTPTQPPGTPDGFTAHPIADGFQPPAH